MSKYLRRIRAEATLDDEPVVAYLRPISFIHFVELTGLLPTAPKDTDDFYAQGLELNKRSMEVMREYVVELKVLAADGEEIPLDEIFTAQYFRMMLSTIYHAWYRAGSPKNPLGPVAGASGNSTGPLSPPKTETTTETAG